MKIDRETLLLAADDLETKFGISIRSVLEGMPEEAISPPTKKDMLTILLGAAALTNLATNLPKLAAAGNSFLSSIDATKKTDEQILEELQNRFNQEYFQDASAHAGKALVIIQAVIRALAKRYSIFPKD